MPAPLGDDHFERLSPLLDLEADAEREQAAPPPPGRTPSAPPPPLPAGGAAGGGGRPPRQTGGGGGRALPGLVVRDEDAGLGGRLLLTFGKRDTSQPLPPTRLQPGSPVLLK